MHEKRNFVMVLLLIGGISWSLVAWFMLQPGAPMLLFQKIASIMLTVSMAAWLFYAMVFEDKLPDHLGGVVGQFYYEADGISFMPIIRVRKGQAELCVYYQNRYENPVEAIVHLRPPPPEGRHARCAFRVSGQRRRLRCDSSADRRAPAPSGRSH
jgi:hypothetical protein